MNPLDFGAIGDGVADDTAAVQACFNAASAAKRPVELPGQRFLLSGKLTYTGGLSLVGPSMRSAEFEWTASAASRGIDVTLPFTAGLRQTVEIESVSLLSAGAGVGQALRVKDQSPNDRITPSVVVRNTMVSGSTNPNQNGWAIGFDLDGCQGAWLDGVYIWGKRNSPGSYVSTHGVRYTNSQALSPHPSELLVTNSQIKEVSCAVHADDMEGLVVSGNQIVGVNIGVNAYGAQGFPDVRVVNNHINATQMCVAVNKMYQANISGNSLYNQSHTSAGCGVNIFGAARFFSIRGNIFENYETAQASNLLVVSNGDSGVVGDNIFRRANSINGAVNGVGVWLTSGASNVRGSGNVFSETATLILNQGVNNFVS
jgi:hypothetical protein